MQTEEEYERSLDENFARHLTDGFAFFQRQTSGFQRVVFYGIGDVFRRYAPRMIGYLRRIGIEALCCDDAPAKWGQRYEGVVCLSPQELLERRNGTGVVITVENNETIRKFLDGAGILWLKQIQPWLSTKFYRRNHHLPPETYFARAAQANAAFADEKSRQVFQTVFSYPLLCPEDLEGIREQVARIYEPDHYFTSELIKLSTEECFVDGGAFIGDTFADFSARVHGKFSHYYAFELSPTNFAQLQATYGGQPNITLFNQGLWSHKQWVNFCDRSFGSMIGRGEMRAETIDLDTALSNRRVTFIKMDVEGSELAALNGAQNIIREQKPVLAISAYHRMDHLYEVPLTILSLCPDYRIYLRQHAELWCDEILETVCYAIPPGR